MAQEFNPVLYPPPCYSPPSNEMQLNPSTMQSVNYPQEYLRPKHFSREPNIQNVGSSKIDSIRIMRNYEINNPMQPYCDSFFEQLHVGGIIRVDGVSSDNKKGRIHFNLLMRNPEDIFLHINPRFDQRELVLNTKSKGKWMKEERYPLALQNDSKFTFTLFFHESHTEIHLNEKKYSFKHRLPLDGIQKLQLHGSCILSYISIRPFGAIE